MLRDSCIRCMGSFAVFNVKITVYKWYNFCFYCVQDAYNCDPQMDTDTGFFAVYDGHGGK